MIKHAILFLALIIASQASLRPISDSEFDLDSDPKQGVVTLYYTSAGYVVPVAFTYGGGYNYMVISLYTGTTIFTQTCLQFSPYFCSQYSTCTKGSSIYNINYPNFSIQGNVASTTAYLEYSSWVLSQNAPVLVATSCSTNAYTPYGSGAYGVLGMGFEGGARGNFIGSTTSFSVYYLSGAFRLEFNPNMNFPKNLIATFRTTQSWLIPNIASISLGSLTNKISGVSAMFDINFDTIGFPISLYYSLIGAFTQLGVNCPQNVYYQPICSYNGNFNSLPNLVVSIDPATNILLTPTIYAIAQGGNSVKLNLRATSTQLGGLNYVTPDYANYIILGNTVLGNYYTYFDLNASAVTIYQRTG